MTDQRQLRLMIDSLLSTYGVDDLSATAQFCKAFNQFYESKDPVRTREEIIASLQKSILNGSSKHSQLEAISDEIHKRVGIRPATKDWLEFVEFAWRQNRDKQQSITAFLDWWLSDQWQLEHPPTRPDGWLVKWDLAFKDAQPITEVLYVAQPDPNEGKYTPAPGRPPTTHSRPIADAGGQS